MTTSLTTAISSQPPLRSISARNVQMLEPTRKWANIPLSVCLTVSLLPPSQIMFRHTLNRLIFKCFFTNIPYKNHLALETYLKVRKKEIAFWWQAYTTDFWTPWPTCQSKTHHPKCVLEASLQIWNCFPDWEFSDWKNMESTPLSFKMYYLPKLAGSFK